MSELFEIAKELACREGAEVVERRITSLKRAIQEFLETFDEEDHYHVSLLSDAFFEKLRAMRKVLLD